MSELRFITAEAVRTGRVQVYYKCKCRAAFLPEALRQKLQSYLKVQKKNGRAGVCHQNRQAPGPLTSGGR